MRQSRPLKRLIEKWIGYGRQRTIDGGHGQYPLLQETYCETCDGYYHGVHEASYALCASDRAVVGEVA